MSINLHIPKSLPYYAVIHTSVRTDLNEGYADLSRRIIDIASKQSGFLGLDSAFDLKIGISVSYWKDKKSILAWNSKVDALDMLKSGKRKWYHYYSIRVCEVKEFSECRL